MRARSAVPLAALIVAACAGTVARAVGAVGLAPFAATPEAVAHGRVWLLATSALVGDAPPVLSLLSFAALGLTVLALCGPRVLWAAALAGHVGSALLVYAAIAVARAVDHGVLASVVSAPDYGVSAISGAWLGTVAAVVWRRCSGARALVVLTVGVVGVVAWQVARPLNALDVEHLVALALGAALVARAPLRVVAGRVRVRAGLPAS